MITKEQSDALSTMSAEDLSALITGATTVSARGARQVQLRTWAEKAFSIEQARSVPQRALRLLEEAIELFQAAHGNRQQAHELIDHVFSQPPGQLYQELGGVSICTLLLAAAAGLSADLEEQREMIRVLEKPIQELTERNTKKNEAGFIVSRLQDPDKAL